MIFQDKKKPASPPDPSPPVAEKPEATPSSSLLPKGKVQHSVISRDLTIAGDIVTSGDVKIEGRVDGNITCRTLTLGQEPVINSTVTAEAVHVCGKFSGEIRADSVVLAKNANVTGDIYQNHLEIQEGASIEGNVRRLDAAKSEEKIKTVKVA